MAFFFSKEDFYERVRAFHGAVTPGLMLGASMVELAMHSLGDLRRSQALCETSRDLPDAVQLLTGCTVGNGRLHVLELGRYALTLYHTDGGRGVRVYLDPAKISGWPHVHRWILGQWEEGEKETVRLEREIRHAGISVLSAQGVYVQDTFLLHKQQGMNVPCIACGELHPADAGLLCRACQGSSPYMPRLPMPVEVTGATSCAGDLPPRR